MDYLLRQLSERESECVCVFKKILFSFFLPSSFFKH